MICPISQEPFRHPEVLPCGHTFDKGSLVGLSQCPLCRRTFHKCQIATNWIVVQHLGLVVDSSVVTEETTLKFTKVDAILLTTGSNERDEQSADRVLPFIIKEIQKNARKGRKSYVYSPFFRALPHPVLNSLKRRLNANGFYVDFRSRCFTVGKDLYVNWS